MSIVAIKSIGIVSENQNSSSTPRSNPQQVEYFSAFNQEDASIAEKSEEDTTGIAFTQEVNFIVRRTNDIKLAQKHLRRPVALHVYTVDGGHYQVGNQQDPVYLQTNNLYDGTKVREMQVSVKTQSLFPLF